jgi:hypothetical protein
MARLTPQQILELFRDLGLETASERASLLATLLPPDADVEHGPVVPLTSIETDTSSLSEPWETGTTS